MNLAILPHVNAALNAASTVLLLAGFAAIRAKRLGAHIAAMLAALATSTAFLISYLIYHAHHGATPFAGQGLARLGYFAVLISHTALAAAILPLAGLTLYRAARRQYDRHVRIARWTLPIWLYVSVTGVAIYWVLYHVLG